MDEVIRTLNNKGHGSFFIMDGSEKLGDMLVAIANRSLTVYHTEVAPEAEGKGLAKKLLDAMVAYAREQQLTVIPLCPYVHIQFKRHPELYGDVWKPNESRQS
jgi:predicted GNAT family acetyltransferase